MKTNIEPYADYLAGMSGKILLGCDGFVDEVYEIVEERKSLADFSTIKDLRDFGELIVSRAGGGVGVEIVPKRRCEGGFAINTGRIAGCLGLKSVLPGLYGAKEIDSAYEEFTAICELISLGDPALTLAFEFANGKLLMSDLGAVSNLKWEDFETHFGGEKIDALFSDVDIIGLGYWSLTANFDGLFNGFMAQYKTRRPPRRMFFDFADIRKKSRESFTKSLELIRPYNSRIPMSLSMNEHEGMELFSRLDVPCTGVTPQAMAEALAKARETMGFDELIIHTADFAVASSASEGEACAMQERQTEVIRLAGAGDSFNGGFICASLGALPLKQRLAMGNATTAFFVTHGTGPDKNQLVAQLQTASDK